MKTTAWRIVASKNLIVFGIAAGYGQDKYDAVGRHFRRPSNAGGDAASTGDAKRSAERRRSTSRARTCFADLSLNLPLLKIVGEVGQVSGGTVDTYNSFSGGARTDRVSTARSACA